MPENITAESVLRDLEWSATYSYCTGWPCCPVCKGIKPGHGADEHGDLPNNQGHRKDCRLAAAIAPDETLETRTVSRPDAVLKVTAVPIPPKVQSMMADAIRESDNGKP